jgi:hypothetical protein
MVRPAESLVQLINQGRDMHRDLLAADRTSLKKALDLGRVLNKVKAASKPGEWLPSLEKMGIDRRRASEFRALDNAVTARVRAIATGCPAPPDIASCNSVREALRLVAHDGRDEEETQQDGAGSASKQILCPRCQRTGQVKDCPQCAELARRSNKSEPREKHEESDGEEEKAQGDGHNRTGRKQEGENLSGAEHAKKQNGKRPSPKKKTEAALNVVVRYLDKHGLYEKHKGALDLILKEIKQS